MDHMSTHAEHMSTYAEHMSTHVQHVHTCHGAHVHTCHGAHVSLHAVRIPKGVVLKHSKEPMEDAKAKRDIYFDILKLPLSPSISADKEDAEEKGKVAKVFHIVLKWAMGLLDDFNQWLEDNSALFREVVKAVHDSDSRETSESPPTVQEEIELSPPDSPGGRASPEIVPAAEDSGGAATAGGATARGTVGFDQRAGLLEQHLAPTTEQVQETQAYEAELREHANEYTRRFKRLGRALYYVFLSNNQYVPFFFIILNIIINGSLLSLIYAVLLFGWGLLSVPWPSKRFWLSLIFYTMFVLVVKYGFQFHAISFWSNFDDSSGLYPPRLIGIEKREDFLANAVVDILLLMFLLIHRGLLFVRRGGGKINHAYQQTP